MNTNTSIPITHLKDGKFIEIYRLETMDDSVFKIYQRYDFYQIMFFTKVDGNNSYFIDFNDFIYRSNQAVVIYPGQIDRIHLEGKEGILFAVDKETYLDINRRINSNYLSGYFSNVFVDIDSPTCKALNDILALMYQEYEAENRFHLMESYMDAFLFLIADSFEKMEKTSLNAVNNTVAELQELIDRHFIAERDTGFYARKLGLTNKRLNDIIFKSKRCTVKQLLQEALLLEIKRELRLGGKNLKEIAFELGFNDAAYLTRFFKRHTSSTPSEFRDSGQ